MTPEELADIRPLLVAARRGRTFTVQAKWALERYIEDHGGEVVVMETLLAEVDRLRFYEHAWRDDFAEVIREERARVRAAVETLPAGPTTCRCRHCAGKDVERAAVLAAIDGGEA